jgi:large subunit ribosomal protein L13
MEYTIDAKEKSVGRIASEAAVFLMGKNLPSFKRNAVPSVKVSIINTSLAKFDPKKLDDKIYKRYSGYPGGQREIPMKKIIEKKGASEVFRIAVKGMLPKNRLQNTMMKNLSISE